MKYGIIMLSYDSEKEFDKIFNSIPSKLKLFSYDDFDAADKEAIEEFLEKVSQGEL